MPQEAAALRVVRGLAPGARLVYGVGGTQKFELPLEEVSVDGVFRRMEEVKLRCTAGQGWEGARACLLV